MMAELSPEELANASSSSSFFRQLWRFGRPHTIIGTSLSLLALWILAAGLFETEPVFQSLGSTTRMGFASSQVIGYSNLLLTWLGCIGANIYIVGLNQLTDIPLDRINKPYLPLASGAWSPALGRWVIGVCFGVSLLACSIVGSEMLWWTVGLSLVLGTLYSMPPVRLKRFNFWAAFCIIAVRSLIVNLLLFAHVAQWQASVLDLPPPVWLLTFVMFAFSIAIAWFKDLPDVAGDAKYDVQTLSVRLGPQKMLVAGSIILALALALTSYGAFTLPLRSVHAEFLSGSQLVVLLAFLILVWRVNIQEQASIRRFYLSLWGLFFGEYVLFAVAAMIG